MRRLTANNSRNREVIFAYIGGEEVNSSPTHEHHRYVINFGERGEEECRRRWPELIGIVEQKVKPERMQNNREVRKKYWWRFGETAPALYAAISALERVLVCPGGTAASKYLNFTFLGSNMVYSQTLCVFTVPTDAAFCALQARPHEVWARFFGSTLEDRLRYNSSDCFETYPFPEDFRTQPALGAAGRSYCELRAALMVGNKEGLTKTYNRFHDPDERNPDIVKLRELHVAMDRAVLDAYRWHDIPTECEFLLDYEIDEEEWGDKKKPYRYRWPDEVRDEVLARLLELNAERARAETLTGAAANTRAGRQTSKRATGTNGTKDLFS
jgi:hypothetical protein